MPTYKLTLAYDGTEFSGWQAQPGRRTVQGALQEAWREITGESIRVHATSRTDAGVHALGQVVGVETRSQIPAEKLQTGINSKLPEDIVLRSVEAVAEGFHATHDAVCKRYRYQIYQDRRRPLFDRRYVWHVHQTLDVEAMQRAGQEWIGTHDFASFQSSGSPRENTVRTVTHIEVTQHEESAQIWVEVEGDGFLYNMVRNIVGSLVEVGIGRHPESWAKEVLTACDRRSAGRTAPPQGLFLLWVKFGT